MISYQDQDFEIVPQDASSLPRQKYLKEVFAKLKQNRKHTKYPQISIGTVFQGYKTIHIQTLERKPTKISDKLLGSKTWFKDLVVRFYHYRQSCQVTQFCQNGFFQAFLQAYINHGDIKITSDEVWMAIMLYFSNYVNDNAEKLRHAFVTHEGKKELEIRSQKDKSQFQWDQFFQKMIIAIKENTTKGATQKLQCSFTTTNPFFKIISTATIMNSFKRYFDYTRVIEGCGIVNIHMGGCLQDWQLLAQKLSNLKAYDVNGQLKRYVNRLEPVLEQFIETFKGQANLQFWNNLYHERQNPHIGAYEPKLYANGWIIRFFTTDDYIRDTADIEAIDVPIKFINLMTNTVKNINLVGGCRGILVQDHVYRPHFSFAIVQKRQPRKTQRGR